MKAQVLIFQPELTRSTWTDHISRHRSEESLRRYLRGAVKRGEYVGYRLLTVREEHIGATWNAGEPTLEQRAAAEGWISAKQSMPQDTRHILVICEREHEDDARRRWFMRMAWRLMNSDGSFRGWWQVVGGDEQFADKIVRYWRELPQMPAILTEGKR